MKFARRLILCCIAPCASRRRRRRAARIGASAQRSRVRTTACFKLFKESDEANLRRNPLQALFRGDYRYADRLGDLFSDAHYQAEKAAAEHDLASAARDSAGPTSARTTRSPMTCSNTRPRTPCAELQPDLLTLTEALADEPLFRPAHGISNACKRPRRRALRDRRGL